jgi:hypothetical protein
MSDCNYLTVVTILVVFVDYGESSSCSTYLILFRRFSSLYACFCMVASRSCVVLLLVPSVNVFCGIYCTYYSYSALNFLSMYISMPYRILSSPSRSNPSVEEPPCLLMVCCIPSTYYCKRTTAFPCVVW